MIGVQGLRAFRAMFWLVTGLITWGWVRVLIWYVSGGLIQEEGEVLHSRCRGCSYWIGLK
jgi:hypothetical protein